MRRARATGFYETLPRHECAVGSHETRPAEGVLNWLHGRDEDRTFISIVSIAEIRRGVALMDKGRQSDALNEWLTHDLPQRFDKRTVSVEGAVALARGDLMALDKRRGRGLASMDGLIAAMAIAHDLTLATRNIRILNA